MAESFSLLETMRLENGRVTLLERHLSRMGAPAGHFDYVWNEAGVRDAVAGVAHEHPEGCWRLRLLLDRGGVPSIACTLQEEGESRVWRVALAASPVDARDPFLFHKTTHRVVYDAARQARPDVDDVLLWNQRGEITESTIANVVAELDGVRVTPPVVCGLLAGTYRAEFLESGALGERVLTTDDVSSAPRLWLINSLRGWIDVELLD